METKIEVNNIKKGFVSEKGPLQVVDGVSFTVKEGEFVAIVGPSGCGKSTLMNMISGFTQPDEGMITVDGTERTRLRAATELLMDIPLYVDDTTGLTVADMYVKINAILRDKPLGLLNVDGYYDALLGFLKQVVERGFVAQAQSDLLEVDSDASQLLARLADLAQRATGPDDYQRI